MPYICASGTDVYVWFSMYKTTMRRSSWQPWGRLNIKMSYRYRDPHVKDKTLYWNGAHVVSVKTLHEIYMQYPQPFPGRCVTWPGCFNTLPLPLKSRKGDGENVNTQYPSILWNNETPKKSASVLYTWSNMKRSLLKCNLIRLSTDIQLSRMKYDMPSLNHTEICFPPRLEI